MTHVNTVTQRKHISRCAQNINHHKSMTILLLTFDTQAPCHQQTFIYNAQQAIVTVSIITYGTNHSQALHQSIGNMIRKMYNIPFPENSSIRNMNHIIALIIMTFRRGLARRRTFTSPGIFNTIVSIWIFPMFQI